VPVCATWSIVYEPLHRPLARSRLPGSETLAGNDQIVQQQLSVEPVAFALGALSVRLLEIEGCA